MIAIHSPLSDELEEDRKLYLEDFRENYRRTGRQYGMINNETDQVIARRLTILLEQRAIMEKNFRRDA